MLQPEGKTSVWTQGQTRRGETADCSALFQGQRPTKILFPVKTGSSRFGGMHKEPFCDGAVEGPSQVRQHRQAKTGLDMGVDGRARHRDDRDELEHNRENIQTKA